jgi:hypothetical protein
MKRSAASSFDMRDFADRSVDETYVIEAFQKQEYIEALNHYYVTDDLTVLRQLLMLLAR